jgi:hypothetical protein
MAALSVRESIRYGVRLFGYLLVTTVLGGGLVVGGTVLSTRVDVVGTISGTAEGSYAVVAGAVSLSLLGVLVLATGWLLVAFVAVTDAVRVGIDRSSLGPDVIEDESGEPETPEDDQPGTAEEPESTPEPEQSSDPLGGGGSDPFDDHQFDDSATSDPLGGSGGGRSEPADTRQDQTETRTDRRQAGPTRKDDDEAWRREIEAKLDEDE